MRGIVIGKLTADEWGGMKIACLRELSARIVTIPARWKSAVIYDALVEDGTAAPVLNVGPLMNGYTITEAGRERLKEFALMARK